MSCLQIQADSISNRLVAVDNSATDVTNTVDFFSVDPPHIPLGTKGANPFVGLSVSCGSQVSKELGMSQNVPSVVGSINTEFSKKNILVRPDSSTTDSSQYDVDSEDPWSVGTPLTALQPSLCIPALNYNNGQLQYEHSVNHLGVANHLVTQGSGADSLFTTGNPFYTSPVPKSSIANSGKFSPLVASGSTVAAGLHLLLKY